MKRRVLVIHNPTAGRRRQKRVADLIELLKERGYQPEIHPTTRSGDAREAARLAEGMDVIVAAGGGGTVNEVVDGLYARAGHSQFPAIGFLPMGTANVLVSELNLPKTPAGLVDLIEKNKVILVHPGSANGRRFVLMASAGLDARTVAVVSAPLKKRVGGAAYLLAALKALRMPSPEMSVVIDGRAAKAHTVIVTRGRCYGGPFVVAPDAGLDQPKLYVILLHSAGWFAVLRYGLALGLGRLHKRSDVTVLAGSEIGIDGPEGAPVQMDGDIVIALPLQVSVEERAVGFLVP